MSKKLAMPGWPTIDQHQAMVDLQTMSRGHDVVLNMGAMDAWVLMSVLQLVCRHPDLQGMARTVAEVTARTIQSNLATTPALQQLAEAGWISVFDTKKGGMQ